MDKIEMGEEIESGISCKQCGAFYKSLPAFTCPRCGNILCESGCDKCHSQCHLKLREAPAKHTK